MRDALRANTCARVGANIYGRADAILKAAGKGNLDAFLRAAEKGDDVTAREVLLALRYEVKGNAIAHSELRELLRFFPEGN